MTGLLSRPRSRRPQPATARRVRLRMLARTDAAAFVAAVQASRALHRAWVHPPATIEEFRRRLPRAPSASNRVALVAVDEQDGALVGIFNLSEIVRGPLQQAYLGYYAFASHAGRGYMLEAMALVLDHAFRVLRLHRIEANIQPDNAPSIALMQRAGFSKEGFSPRYLKIAGRWRDHERWAINADDWRAQRRRRAAQDA